jgi:multiple sugar transport system substrate-binding protein
MHQKVFALFISLVLLLAACSTPQTTPTSESATQPPIATSQAAEPPSATDPITESTNAKVSLRFSAWGNPEQTAAIAKIIAAFVEKYPNIEVTEEYDPWDGYWEKKTTQVAGDQLPDVFAIASDYVCEYANAGLLTDLGKMHNPGIEGSEMLSGLPPQTLANLNVNGQQIGYPFAGGALLLYYNKTLFDAASLEYPNPSWTLQDVLDASTALSVDSNNDGELDSWGYMPNYYTQEDLDAILHRFGARWFSDDGLKALSDTPEAADAVKFLQDIIYTYKISPRPQDIDGIECPFCAGLIAMYEDGTWFMSDARAITDFKWDVTSIPLGFEGQQGGGALRGNPNFVVASNTAYPAEASLLAAFLASPEGQIILGEAKGRMPVQPAGLDSWASAPPENIVVISEVLAAEPYILEPLCVPHAIEVADLIYRMMEGEMITNNTPASDLMPNLTRDIQAILDTP